MANPDMTIEKLQKIVTTPVEPKYKTRWLKWWNSSLDARKSFQLPDEKSLKDKTLDTWLNKASFWAQVSFYLLIYLLLKPLTVF